MASEEKCVYTACPGWGDHDYCVIKTIVEDGKIVRAEKADYPDKYLGDSHICQKGLESIKQPYNKERLLYPLKRKGARGAGDWERISWDQALDEIAEKMLEIRDNYGPESVSFWNFIAGYPPMTGLGPVLASRFAGLWGATDGVQSYGLDNGPQYAMQYVFNHQMGFMSFDPRCLTHSDLIIVWGANPVENQQRIARNLIRAKENGARIIDIGLVFDGTAGLSDWFIPAKPGTDLYLALAMANYIVTNKRYNIPFMNKHTIAPYLVDVATGQYIRDENENYFIWDETAGKPVALEPKTGQVTIDTPAYFGTYDVSGTQCKPAFELLTEHLASYTLEEAERITGVSAQDIIKLTEEYITADKAFLLGALGLRYQNQGETYRAFYLLGCLVGKLGDLGSGVMSGLLSTSAPIMFNNYGIARPNGPKGNKIKFVRQKDFFPQILSGDPYPIKAMFVTSGNPAHNCPNRGRWIEAFEAMDLVVDIDIWMTDTGELADYVLPDCMPFERKDIIDMAAYGHVVLQEPAIEPMGEAKDPSYFYRELSKRVGLGEYFDKTADDWLEEKLKVDYPPITSLDPPLTLDRLKKEKMVPIAWPKGDPFDGMRAMEFVTETGKIEFYAERLVEVEQGFPTYFPPLESPTVDTPNEKYPYQFFSGRQRFFMQSMFTNDPLMIELSGKEPSARINPIDAAREGIDDGDKVEVYNQRGHVVSTMRLDEAIPPGTIQVWFGWRQKQFEEGTYAELLVPLGDESTTTPAGEYWYDEAKKVYGEEDHTNGLGTGYAGGWDTIWDCACALRKLEDGKGA